MHDIVFMRFDRSQRDNAFRRWYGRIGASMKVEVLSGFANVEGSLPLFLYALYKLRQWPILQHFVQNIRMLQQRIPCLKTAHLEVEAPAHRFIHGYNAIGDLWCH